MRRDMRNNDMKRPIHRLLGGLCAGVVCCILGACSDRADESGFSVPDGQMNRISLQPGIMPIDIDSGYPSLASELQTQIRDSRFKVGDSVGFFSIGGKIGEGGSSSNFENLKLIYNGRTFSSDVLSDYTQADPGRMDKFFSYYPYREGMETKEGVDIYAKGLGADGSDDEGHALPLRAMDFLTTNYSGNGEQMSRYGGANFYHTFAIVRVKLGKGFDDFDGDIYLQLERKVKGVRIDMSLTDPNEDDRLIVMDNYITGAVMKLVYDDTATSADSRRLKTFPNKETDTNKKRWDVIVPCRPMMWWNPDAPDAAKIGGVTVQAIILDPKEGEEIEIPVDNYEAFVGQIDAGYVHGIRGYFIYTVCIEKEGFGASVFPVNVQKWNEGKITENIPVGITNAAGYHDFILAYNEQFKDNRAYSEEEIATKAQALRNWGTEVIEGSKSVFTVFLTGDIDLSEDAGMDNLNIDNLVIPIDGRGNTIRNCHLDESFCNTIYTGGSLKNLRFENLQVVSTDTVPIGLLAGTMEGGSIEGCQVIRGQLKGGTPETKVGAAVGTMKDGTVKNCRFDGLMVGTSDETHDDLVGVYEKGNVTEGNRNSMR